MAERCDAVTRKRRRAAVGTALMATGPSVVVGVVPWLLTRWRVRRPVPGGTPARVVGVVLIASGVAVIAHSYVRFVTEGLGTPAPVAPPERLVVGGIYRYVRNPIYLAMGLAVVGQALLLGRPKLLLYPAIAAGPVATFVRLHEEPVLARRFGAEYEEYRRNVPRWLPRVRPWCRDDHVLPAGGVRGIRPPLGPLELRRLLLALRVGRQCKHSGWAVDGLPALRLAARSQFMSARSNIAPHPQASTARPGGDGTTDAIAGR
jgi:protein-S-isoprenylcysteine O-methyltransferase Ste14